MGTREAEAYEAWYASPRGRWIADREFALMWRLLTPAPGSSLLDVGCGSGQFSRRFAAAGLRVVGLDPDPQRLAVARRLAPALPLLRGQAARLPFADGAFDHVAAVTSLCFVDRPAAALAELWRVCRRGLVLGLLNRHSLLYRRKRARGGYRGARWDSAAEVRRWANTLSPRPRLRLASAIFLPEGNGLSRLAEPALPTRLALGGFLAAALLKPEP